MMSQFNRKKKTCPDWGGADVGVEESLFALTDQTLFRDSNDFAIVDCHLAKIAGDS
jgi:hypothetical protein